MAASKQNDFPLLPWPEVVEIIPPSAQSVLLEFVGDLDDFPRFEDLIIKHLAFHSVRTIRIDQIMTEAVVAEFTFALGKRAIVGHPPIKTLGRMNMAWYNLPRILRKVKDIPAVYSMLVPERHATSGRIDQIKKVDVVYQFTVDEQAENASVTCMGLDGKVLPETPYLSVPIWGKHGRSGGTCEKCGQERRWREYIGLNSAPEHFFGCIC